MQKNAQLLVTALGMALALPLAALAQNGANAQNAPQGQQPAQPVAAVSAPAPALPPAAALPSKQIIPIAHPRLDAILKSITEARAKIDAQIQAKNLNAQDVARLKARLAEVEKSTRAAAKNGEIDEKEFTEVRQQLIGLYGQYKLSVAL